MMASLRISRPIMKPRADYKTHNTDDPRRIIRLVPELYGAEWFLYLFSSPLFLLR